MAMTLILTQLYDAYSALSGIKVGRGIVYFSPALNPEHSPSKSYTVLNPVNPNPNARNRKPESPNQKTYTQSSALKSQIHRPKTDSCTLKPKLETHPAPFPQAIDADAFEASMEAKHPAMRSFGERSSAAGF